MGKLKLYNLAWEYEQYDRDAEWTHFVLDHYPTSEEIDAQIDSFMLASFDEKRGEDYDIDDRWCSSVEEVDGYEIVVGAKIVKGDK